MKKPIILFLFLLLSTISNSVVTTKEKSVTPISNGELTILTYNLWGLPIWLPKVGVNPRYSKISKQLNIDQYDILCLQECFAKRLREKVLKEVGDNYYHTLDYTCSRKIAPWVKKDCNGGLMTFSKLPVISETFYAYPILDKYSKVERIGHKGFILTQVINQQKDTINIINTHLYAGQTKKAEHFRLQQIMYMDSVLTSLTAYRHTCILNGDLNINHPMVSQQHQLPRSVVYTYIQDKMKFSDSSPILKNEDYTLDKTRNFYSASRLTREKLDYIFTKHKENEEWELKETQTKYHAHNSFSDHLAFMATYTY